MSKRELKELPEVMTVAQVAELLQVTKHTVYQLVESGEVPSFRIGGGKRARIRLLREAVISSLQSRPERGEREASQCENG